MDEIIKDSRFSHVLKDAKFRKLPKKKVKVKIDKRFQSMFHEKKFQVKCEVDKRGRSVNLGRAEDLKRYYDMSESDGDEDEKEKEKEKQEEEEEEKAIKADDKNIVEIRENEKKILTPEIKKKLKDLTIDYARGEGAILSDSSSDEESADEEDLDETEFDHGWGELDKDAERTEEASKRLAVCNLDWDRIEAGDLMVLFNSFLPPGGIIHSITIYPSDFGLQRMKEEEEKGPVELVEASEEKDEEELSKIQMERLRKYQLNRLKYYYAVVECNSPQTAEVLYTECDGLDYECSSSKLDLRFVPDDMTFENEPKETCTTLPDLSTYKPRYFVTSALTKAKVDLTWDETDLNRQEIVKSIHNGNVDENHLRKYLACSSSENEEEEEEESKNEDHKNAVKFDSNKKMGCIDKFKALLADIESNESKNKKNAVNMEVTWNLELENKATEVVKEAIKEKNAKTPFEKYLEKRKEKKKKKRLEKQLQSNGQDQQESGDSAFSDDDVPSDIDLNDPYFKEELDAFKSKKSSKKKKPKKGEEEEEEEEDEESKQKKAELQLLMLDNEPENKHFSLKKIEESEKVNKKKLKKGKKRKAEESNQFNDDFKIDVNDERFSALYTSHHFNIDPADPQFKATKATRQLIEEKLKRREMEEDGSVIKKKKAKEVTEESEERRQDQDVELINLVKSVKKNTSGVKKKT